MKYVLFLIILTPCIGFFFIENVFALDVTDKENGYGIEYPKDWEINTNPFLTDDVDYLSSAFGHQKDDFAEVYTYFYNDIDPSTLDTNFIDKLEQVVSDGCHWFGYEDDNNYCENPTIIETEKLTIDGREAYSIFYSYDYVGEYKNGQKTYGVRIFEKVFQIIDGGKTWSIFTVAYEGFPHSKIDEIIQSFHIYYDSDKIFLKRNLSVNLFVLGNDLSDSEKNKIISNLPKSSEPSVLLNGNKVGVQYFFDYNFVNIAKNEQTDFLSFMEKSSTKLFGDNFEEESLYMWWIENKHPEWLENFNSKYNFVEINAKDIEDYMYDNFVPDNHRSNDSVNLFFMLNDLDDFDSLHTYTLSMTDKSHDKKIKSTGLMGYGGDYNQYFFDLYAIPRIEYDEENQTLIVSEFAKNLHDCVEDLCLEDTITQLTSDAIFHIVTPSFVYPPKFSPNYVLDIVMYSQNLGGGGVSLTEGSVKSYLNTNLIQQELEELSPLSDFSIELSFENPRSRGITNDFKKSMSSRDNFVIPTSDSGVKIGLSSMRSYLTQPELVKWAESRNENKNFSNNIKFPILVYIDKSPNIIVIDYSALGIALDQPLGSGDPCCVLSISSPDNISSKISNSDLVIHEVGHLMGLAHPFQSWKYNLSNSTTNDYFNWYSSPMIYGSPPIGCGNELYRFYEICGIANTSFSEFEKRAIQDAQLSTLIKKIRDDITFLSKTEQGFDQKEIQKIELQLDSIQKEFQNDPNNLQLISKSFDISLSLTDSDLPEKFSGQISKYGKLIQIESSYYFEPYKNNFIEIKGQLHSDISGYLYDIFIVTVEPNGNVEQYRGFTNNSGEFTITIPMNRDTKFGEYTFDVYIGDYLIDSGKFNIHSYLELKNESLTSKIPSWVKNNAKWWADGKIGDDAFTQGIEFLVKEGIMNVESKSQSSTETKEIPSWVKNNAKWWADDSIDDESFISGIEFLVKEGIILVD